MSSWDKKWDKMISRLQAHYLSGIVACDVKVHWGAEKSDLCQYVGVSEQGRVQHTLQCAHGQCVLGCYVKRYSEPWLSCPDAENTSLAKSSRQHLNATCLTYVLGLSQR